MSSFNCPHCHTSNPAAAPACCNCGLAPGSRSETGPPPDGVASGDDFSPASIGSHALRLLGGTLPQLLPVAALAAALQLFSTMLTATTVRNSFALGGPDWKAMLLSGVLSMIVFPVASATYLRALIGFDSKAPTSLGTCLTFGLGRGLGLIPSMIALGILAFICGIVLIIPLAILGTVGMALLGLLGLFLGARWFAAMPAAVLEDIGLWAGLSRSTELTRACRPLTCGLVLVALAMNYAVGQTVGDGTTLVAVAMSGYSHSKGVLLGKAYLADFVQMLIVCVQLTLAYVVYRQATRNLEYNSAF